MERLLEAPEPFDEAYFTCYHTGQGPVAYDRSPMWLEFFASVADEIVRVFRPSSVLDVGCALGLLVESLWDRAVHAEGIDVSRYAISAVRPDMRRYCRVANLTDPLEGSFDLVTCIEVLEHLEPANAQIAIANMCRVTDTILFSSTPSDFGEPTHINVCPPIVWIELFAAQDFGPDLLVDGSFVSPHTLIFRKGNSCDVSLQKAYALISRYRSLAAERLEALGAERKEAEAARQSQQRIEAELSQASQTAGPEITRQAELLAEARARVLDLEQQLAVRASSEAELRAAAQAALDAQLRAEHQATEQTRQHTEAQAAFDAQLQAQAKVSLEARQRADAQAALQAKLRSEALATLAAETKRYQSKVQELQALLHDIQSSDSWRLTRPVRLASITLRSALSRLKRRGKSLEASH